MCAHSWSSEMTDECVHYRPQFACDHMHSWSFRAYTFYIDNNKSKQNSSNIWEKQNFIHIFFFNLFIGTRLWFIKWDRNGFRRSTFERTRPALGIGKFDSFIVFVSQSFITRHTCSTSANEVNGPGGFSKYIFYSVSWLSLKWKDCLMRVLNSSIFLSNIHIFIDSPSPICTPRLG